MHGGTDRQPKNVVPPVTGERVSCGFTSQSTQNRSFQNAPQANSWIGMEKLNLTHKKTYKSTHSPIKRNIRQHKINTKPGLVASYDIRPGNGEGLFWFWCFINLSLTYLLRQLATYLRLWDPHGAITARKRRNEMRRRRHDLHWQSFAMAHHS